VLLTGDEVVADDFEARSGAKSSSRHYRHRRRADLQHEVDPLAEPQLLQHQTGLDGFAQADIIGNEEIGARQLEGAFERHQLMVQNLDAGAKGASKRRASVAVTPCQRKVAR